MRDGSAKRVAFEHAAQDLDLVALVALGHQPALPGPAAIEVGLDALRVEREAWWAAVDDDADAASVGLAEGMDAEGVSPAAAHPHQDRARRW